MTGGILGLLREAFSSPGRLIALLFGITAAANVGLVMVSIYTMEVYDRVINTRSMATLAALSVGFVAIMGVAGLLDYVRGCLLLAVGSRLASRLGLRALLGASRLSEGAGQGDQIARDIANLRLFASSPAVATLFDAIWMPLLLVTLFLVHWGYGLVGLVCVATLVLLNFLIDVVARQPIAEADAAAVRAHAEIASTIRNAEAVEAMGMFPAIAKRWQHSQASMLDLAYGGGRVVKMLSAGMRAFRILVTGGMVAIGVILTTKGLVSAGTLLAANLLLARLLMPCERLVSSWQQWLSILAAWRRVRAALDAPPGGRDTRPLPCHEGRLQVDRLVYVPPGSDRPLIRGLSFSIEPGEILAVIGPSGAGKSTLARLLLGILEPSSGGVYLDGASTFTWERDDFGRHVGFLSQSVSLIEGSIAENISRLRQDDPAEIVAAARKAGLHDFIASLPNGYDTLIGERDFTLSGGQRQRLGLARALYGDPKLLVLDEPNANLDQEGEAQLLDAMAAARAAGITVIVIAHRPAIIAGADKILVLQEGTAKAFGAAHDLVGERQPERVGTGAPLSLAKPQAVAP